MHLRTQNPPSHRAEPGRFAATLSRGPGGVVTIGAVRFSRNEASYIQATAGQMLSGGPLPRPVGIDDIDGRRWLLSCTTKAEVTVMRHDVAYSLEANKIQRRMRPRGFAS